jgi:hypothetical protein
MVDTFWSAPLRAVQLRCSAVLPIEPSWMKLRGQLIHEEQKMTFRPSR